MIKQLIVNVLTSILRQIVSIMPPAAVKRNIGIIGDKIEAHDDTFFTYHLRPKNASQLSLIADKSNQIPLTAIVMQGPLLLKDNFTLETCKIYEKTFVNAVIIVSTWEGEDETTLTKLKERGVVVLRNKKPSNGGPLNINYQLVSTINGIDYAKKIDAKYVLKTRCDQRMYKPQLDAFFIKLIVSFPITLKTNPQPKGRIVALNFTTIKYRPYGIGDMMLFGHTQDIYAYWNADLDFRAKGNDSNCTVLEYAQKKYAETYLCVEYLKKLNWNFQWTIQDTWLAYKELFIIIDTGNVDFFWNKYQKNIEYRRLTYSPNAYELYFLSDWCSVIPRNYKYNEDFLNAKI